MQDVSPLAESDLKLRHPMSTPNQLKNGHKQCPFCPMQCRPGPMKIHMMTKHADKVRGPSHGLLKDKGPSTGVTELRGQMLAHDSDDFLSESGRRGANKRNSYSLATKVDHLNRYDEIFSSGSGKMDTCRKIEAATGVPAQTIYKWKQQEANIRRVSSNPKRRKTTRNLR